MKFRRLLKRGWWELVQPITKNLNIEVHRTSHTMTFGLHWRPNFCRGGRSGLCYDCKFICPLRMEKW